MVSPPNEPNLARGRATAPTAGFTAEYHAAYEGQRETRVLIVDDDPQLAKAMHDHAAARQWAATTVPKCWADSALRRRRYDLVLLSLTASTEDSALLHRACSASPRVIVLSAAEDRNWVANWLGVGAIDHLAKPFSIEELDARMRARLREPGLIFESPAINAAGMTLDSERRVVHTGNSSRGLSKREFMLLSFLVQNAGRVVTKDEVAESAWGLPSAPRQGVETYVCRLRKIVGDDAIETVRTKGYCFVGKH